MNKEFKFSALGWLLTTLLIPGVLHAEISPENIDQAEELARNAYIEQFTKFTQDKNVMGKVTTPDGKQQGPGKKSRFNRDDGAPFQSDLTYHDNTFNVPEKVGGGGGGQDEKQRTLFAFVSEHGKISGAGGSSVLERTVYGLHEQFSKQDEDPKQKAQDDKQTGTKFRSVFKIETQQVFNKNNAQGGGGNKEDQEPEKVERVQLRDEAKNPVVKVGEDSFETIKRAARDEGNEEDAATMPNMTFLYEAAKRATKAIWDGTLANLGQRRINRGIRGGELDKPQLSQDFPTCDEWSQARGEELNAQLAKAPPERRQQLQQLQQELQRINGQCKQLASLDYKAINPRFEAPEGGGGGGQAPQEVLKTGDVNKEDGISRDLRVQLEVLAKAGKKAADVESNWKYRPEDEQAKLIEYDSKGEAVGDKVVTIQSQMEGYNSNLDEAQRGYEEVKTRLPDLEVPDLSQYYLQPNTKSVMEINQPTQSQLEELGADGIQAPPPSKTYVDLLQKVQ